MRTHPNFSGIGLYNQLEAMSATIVTLFYILFVICTVYPPTEIVSAGFTIAQLNDGYLGSENINFIGYHMKRISLTLLVHSALPMGYVFCLWCSSVEASLVTYGLFLSLFPIGIVLYKVLLWEHDKKKHPVVKALAPYVESEGNDWSMIAANLNTEFRHIDKVCIHLDTVSKIIATQTWLIKVTSYNINLIKQSDCALVATTADSHNLTTSGEDEVQFLNIEVIPSRNNIQKFNFRITTTSLRDIQPRLLNQVRVPEHLTLLPTLIEKFVAVFRQHVNENSPFVVEEELDVCIGCMQVPADVKITRRCEGNPQIVIDGDVTVYPPCQDCHCRAVWCSACMARWWAARSPAPPSQWLTGRGTCPVCRAVFCLLDVCPVVVQTSNDNDDRER